MPAVLLCLVSVSVSVCAFSDLPEMDSQKFPIEVYGDYLEYRTKANQVVTKGHAFIAYKDIQLKADTIQSNTKNEDLFAQGKVDFWKGFDQTKGDFMVYNMKTGKGWMRDASVRRNRNFFKAKDVYISPSYSVAHDILQTTCDNEAHPHYRITASKIETYPGKSMTMEDLRLRWRGTSLYHKARDFSAQHASDRFFTTRQGSSKIDGIFFKFGTDVMVNPKIRGNFTYDYFQKRGSGTGFSGTFTTSKYGNGSLSIYSLDESKRNHSNTQMNFSHNYQLKSGETLSTNLSYTADKQPLYAENQDLNVQMNFAKQFSFANVNVTTSKFYDLDGEKYTLDSGYQILNRVPEVNFSLPGFTLPVLPINTSISGMYGRYEEGTLAKSKNTEKKDIRSSFTSPPVIIGRRFDLTPSFNIEKSWYSEGITRESRTTMVRANQKFSKVTNLEFNYNLASQKGGSPFRFDSMTTTDYLSTRLRIAEHTWNVNPVNFNYNRVAKRLEQVYWDYSRRSRTDAYRNWEFFVRRDYLTDNVAFSDMSFTRLIPGNLNMRYRLASSLWSFDTSITYPQGFKRITDTSINYHAVIRPMWEVSTNGHYNHLTKKFSPLNLALTRDLHCWLGRAEYNLERKEFWVEFSLKAYPEDSGRFRYGADTNRLEAKLSTFDQMTQGYDSFRKQ